MKMSEMQEVEVDSLQALLLPKHFLDQLPTQLAHTAKTG